MLMAVGAFVLLVASSGSASPWHADWDHRIAIEVDAGYIDADLSDFPVYVDLSHLGDDFFATVKPDGSDIVVTAGDGATVLPRELVSMDTAAKTGELHFRAPLLSATTDTRFYIYFSNAAASETNDPAVWQADYVAVWHLQEAGTGAMDEYEDSASGRDGRGGGGTVARVPAAQTGMMGRGQDFDGGPGNANPDYIRVPQNAQLNPGTGSFTITFWARLDTAAGQAGSTNWDLPIGKRSTASNGYYIGADRNQGSASEAGMKFMLGNTANQRVDTPFITFPTGQWTFFAAVLDRAGNMHKISMDGSGAWATAVPPAGSIAPTSDLSIGGDIGESNYWVNGLMDEVRISTVARSDTWVSAEYLNQADPVSFYSVGPVEGPLVDALDPQEGPAMGGTAVTFVGFGLKGATGVTFGTGAVQPVNVVDGLSVEATTAPHPTGTVDVILHHPDQDVLLPDAYTFLGPYVDDIAPDSGPLEGGTTTITGTGLSGVTGVEFGGVAGTGLVVDDDMTIQVETPAVGNWGLVDVTLLHPDADGLVPDGFTYVGPIDVHVDNDVLVADGVATATVTVEVHADANGALVGVGGHIVDLDLDPALGTLDGVTDNGDGTYTATLTAGTAVGAASLTVEVEVAEYVQTRSIGVSFVAGPPDPDASSVDVDPDQMQADGTGQALVTVRLWDAHGNPVVGKTVVLTAQGGLGAVDDLDDGRYTSAYSGGTVAQTDTIEATVDGVPMGTAEVVLLPGAPEPDRSTLSADPATVVADGVDAALIAAALRDAHGNLAGAGHAVELETDLGGLSNVTDHGDGTFSAWLTGTTAGTARVTMDLDGETLEVQVGLRPGSPVASGSALWAAPSQIPADGAAASTVTLVLRDAFGNPVDGHAVVMSTDLGVLGDVQDMGDGSYEVELRGLDPGTATISMPVLGLATTVDLSVPPGPVAVLLGPTGILCAQERVTYHAVAHNGGEAVQQWVFDVDGHIIEQPGAGHRTHVKHVFPEPGSKVVHVTAHFEESVLTHQIVHDLGEAHRCEAPDASFTYTIDDKTVGFTATDASGWIHAWDFGDGTTSIEPSPTHAFDALDLYHVTHTVRDPEGRTATQTRQVHIQSPAPHLFGPVGGLAGSADDQQERADDQPEVTSGGPSSQDPPPVAIASAPGTVTAGDVVELDGSASHGPEGEVLTFRWSQLEGPLATFDGDAPRIAFATTAPGELRFRLTVTANGQSDETVVVFAVRPLGAPLAAFEVEQDEQVHLRDASSDARGATRTWIIGDQRHSGDHLLLDLSPGDHTVRLIVESDKGRSEAVQRIHVTANAPAGTTTAATADADPHSIEASPASSAQLPILGLGAAFIVVAIGLIVVLWLLYRK